MAQKPKSGDCARREFKLDVRVNGDVDERTQELAFSSEAVIDRFFGAEVLSHDKGAVRLERFNSGAALLVNHDPDQHVGVVESARVDDDRVGRAVVRFGDSPFASQILSDVRNKIRQLVSVGYRIHKLEETKTGDVRVVDWEPLEISLVSVPADASVGVDRAIDTPNREMAHPLGATHRAEEDLNMKATDKVGGDAVAENGISHDASQPDDTEALDLSFPEEERTLERLTMDERMRVLARKYNCLQQAERLIETDGTYDDLTAWLRKRILDNPPRPVPAARSPITGGVQHYNRASLRAFRDNEEVAYRAGMWCKAALFQDQEARRWCSENRWKDPELHVRAMSEGVLTAGGALVPEEMSSAIIDLREERGVARSLARVVNMNSDVLSIPRRTGGVTAVWVGEGIEPTASDQSWDNVNLVAKKLGAQTIFSTELAEDSIIDLAANLSREIAYSFADAEDQAFFDGDGTSTYGGIYGLRPKIIDGNHAAGAVDGASGIDTFAEVTQADLDNVLAVLPVYAQPGARWVCSGPCKALVFDSLAAAAGGNTLITLGGRPEFSYLGYPITLAQTMPTSTGDLSNVVMLAVGDFSLACTMGDRRAFRLRLLQERYAELDQLALVAFERVDIVWHDLGDGTDAGPVACLVGE